jgi:hypothetical protein
MASMFVRPIDATGRWSVGVAALAMTTTLGAAGCAGDDFVSASGSSTTTGTAGGGGTVTGTGAGGAITGGGGAGGAITGGGGAGGAITGGGGAGGVVTGSGGAGGAITGSGDAGPVAFCDKHPQALVCDDFESPSYSNTSSLASAWGGALAGSGTVSVILAGDAPSPSHAMEASVGPEGTALLASSPRSTPAGKLRVEYSVRNDGITFAAGALKVVTLAGVAIGTGPDPGTIYLYRSPNGLGVGARPPKGSADLPLTHDLGVDLPVGAWLRWGFVVDFGAGSVQALKDGAPFGQEKPLPDSLKVLAGTPMVIGVGVTRTLNVTTATVSFDDVLVTTP